MFIAIGHPFKTMAYNMVGTFTLNNKNGLDLIYYIYSRFSGTRVIGPLLKFILAYYDYLNNFEVISYQ